MSHASPLRRRTLLSALGLGAGAALLAACGEGTAADGDGLSVVTSAYALSFLVTRIGGEHVALTDLTTSGADAHGLELSVKQTMLVEEADLVLQIPGFQTALDDAIASQDGDNALDVSSVITLLPADAGSAEEGHAGESEEEHAEHAEEGDSHEGHDHGPNDPHFWHDPLRMADLGDAIAARLGELSPEHAEEFTSAAATVREELEQLDADLTSAFEEVTDERRTFITSHAAYTYLADRYDLHQVGISGIDPETEPSPQRLLALETVVRDEEVTTIFFEATASPKVAQTLADNLGIDSAELDNLETQQSPEADYPAVMRSNCTALAESWA
ncbi:zinc ABC transporter, periplasmic-binding protein ZnuA [Brachybacterium sp. SW0106-09]|uniref:metal ABC transporter substrate-binding protein n=1 Tax=Brachybacterium sp. SW0106-09 TaxID=1704590 RepID=UPI0006B56A96|nr:metal ABC transporter substrate-binding protein [Brachybacterium sp. SW0106-09]GAP77245.1 zinc ABC transporter, periplasmic-binding protein ZnuA [Brachybacterium sp. SW0106-09]